MSVDIDYVKKYLESMGFEILDGTDATWYKKYPSHDNYVIKIDLSYQEPSDCKIDYGQKIKVRRKTTSNFANKENLVVLECVNRLLGKGYKPSRIELEKGWRVGGYLDILVRDKNDDSYLMIECKQYGREYNRAVNIILQNEKKEQLLHYYIQEKSTKYVALYCSTLENGKIDYKNSIIPVEQFKNCNNQQEIYEEWDKVFQSKGIFEEGIQPYGIRFIGIRKNDLKQFGRADINGRTGTEGTIFNRFAEILRRHTISDKTNAYNKIFNLFLCKIVDEDEKLDDDELDFQWKAPENAEVVLSRLNDLYKSGMKEYLELDVADVTEDELEEELNRLTNGLNGAAKSIRDMFKQLRLYKNNEFAFKEVINRRTFLENAEVVKEVVKLLEPYQIKYSQKEQFLGEFFERLLNIGIKQEAGQFFTPVPIANFMTKSIPFENIIENKINNKNQEFLPYVIDYACGSGHFLTETMDRVDKILQDIDEDALKTKTQMDNIVGWKRSFKWAKQFVYGIEKDYRLAKTTKVACFLNGDGEANVIYGDGLDNFTSELYRDKLKLEEMKRDNQVFDVVIANPPYSVENFKFLLNDGDESFELFSELTDKSDDIECLFLERTKHLLKDGGYAAVIFPNSLLLNKGIHQKARKLLLKYFEIKGICQFGNKTFAASGQKTSVLFLVRRDNYYWKNAEKIVNKFLETGEDCAFDNVENIFQKYVSQTYPDISFEEYLTELQQDKFFQSEKEKLLYFLLAYGQKVVVVKSGEKEQEKKFLGYEHSSMKKYEGIHPYPDTGDRKITSMLYDNDVLYNPEKVNTYILANFLDEEIPDVPQHLEKHLDVKILHEMIDFDAKSFGNRIFVQTLDNPYLETDKFPLTTLGNEDVAEILDHKRDPIRKSRRTPGEIPYYGANGETDRINDYIFDEKLVLIGEDGAQWDIGENTAYIIDGKSWVNNHAHVVRPNTDNLIHEYLEVIFKRLDFSYLKSRPNGGKLLKSDLTSIKFPLPPTDTQEEIISEMNKYSDNEKYDVLDEYLGVSS
ncbi:MAG: N-6 DNA methylase [Kosmotogaceae bacterium]